jgi:hypothetical protein
MKPGLGLSKKPPGLSKKRERRLDSFPLYRTIYRLLNLA